MLQSLLEQRIAFGLAKAASVLGVTESIFRPTTVNNPTQGVPYGTIVCAYDVKPEFSLVSTLQPGHAYAVLLGDPTRVLAGDYLVGEDTHFVARVEPLRAALCVFCTQTVDFLNTDVSTTAGTNSYGGHTEATDAAVATGWPVSMMARAHAEVDVTKLPSDTRSAFYDVLAPPIPGLSLSFGMRLRDASGQDYEIISAEQSEFGWKLLAGLATT